MSPKISKCPVSEGSHSGGRHKAIQVLDQQLQGTVDTHHMHLIAHKASTTVLGVLLDII